MSVITPPAQVPGAAHRLEAGPALVRPLLVIASLGSAAIHFGFAPIHLQISTVHGAFFLTVAWLQLAWAFAVARKPSTLIYRLGIVLNGAIIGVWIVSRTLGISGEVEPFGFPDRLASALEVFLIVGSVGLLARHLPRTPLRERTLGAVLGASALAVTALVSASMVPSVSGHEMEAAHPQMSSGQSASAAEATTIHNHGDPQPATKGTGRTKTDHTAAVAVPYDPELPIDLGGMKGVSARQQAEAENIVADTLLGLPQWADTAVAEAAGFRSIGDGFTGTEHFVNQANMDDDIILDPNRPESLVYDVKDGKQTLAAAMYMVKRGTPLADVPKLGGALMQWHTHQNLCFNDQGKVSGITNAQGDCPQGLVKPEETPMIHVWIRSHPCGPFAALEGIGGGAIAEGETRLCDSAHGV